MKTSLKCGLKALNQEVGTWALKTNDSLGENLVPADAVFAADGSYGAAAVLVRGNDYAVIINNGAISISSTGLAFTGPGRRKFTAATTTYTLAGGVENEPVAKYVQVCRVNAPVVQGGVGAKAIKPKYRR